MRLRCAMFALAMGVVTCISLPARADDDLPKEEGKPAAREKDKDKKDKGKKEKGEAKDKKKEKQHKRPGPGRPHGQARHRGPGGQASPGHRPGGDPLRHLLLARFDGDRDGKLSDDEWAAVRKNVEGSADASKGDREHGKHARHQRGGDRGRHHAHRGSHGRHHARPGHRGPGSHGVHEFAHRGGGGPHPWFAHRGGPHGPVPRPEFVHRGGPHHFGPPHGGPHHAGPPPHGRGPDHALANRGHDGPGPQHARRGPGGPPHGRRHHRPPSEEVRQAMFRRMDKDGDGKLSEEERDAARQAFHASWRSRHEEGRKERGEDKNDNDQAREHRRGPGANADGPRDGGPPHRAGAHSRGSESGRARFMQRFDKNGDGKLSEEEGKEAHKAFEEFRRNHDRDDDDDKRDRPDDKDDRNEDGKDGDRRDDD